MRGAGGGGGRLGLGDQGVYEYEGSLLGMWLSINFKASVSLGVYVNQSVCKLVRLASLQKLIGLLFVMALSP